MGQLGHHTVWLLGKKGDSRAHIGAYMGWASCYIIITQPTEAVMVLGMDISYATMLLGIGAYESNASKKMDKAVVTTTTVTNDNVTKEEISVPPANAVG